MLLLRAAHLRPRPGLDRHADRRPLRRLRPARAGPDGGPRPPRAPARGGARQAAAPSRHVRQPEGHRGRHAGDEGAARHGRRHVPDDGPHQPVHHHRPRPRMQKGKPAAAGARPHLGRPRPAVHDRHDHHLHRGHARQGGRPGGRERRARAGAVGVLLAAHPELLPGAARRGPRAQAADVVTPRLCPGAAPPQVPRARARQRGAPREPRLPPVDAVPCSCHRRLGGPVPGPLPGPLLGAVQLPRARLGRLLGPALPGPLPGARARAVRAALPPSPQTVSGPQPAGRGDHAPP